MNPISGDHFSYVNSSIVHSEQISYILNKKFSFLNDVNLKYIYQFINFILVFLGITLLHFLNVKKISHLVLCFVFILAARFYMINNGAGGNQHPPLQLLPLFLTSTFLGINDFIFRLTQSIILSIFIFISYIFLIERFGRFNAILVAMAIFTVPAIIYDSVIVESSIWACCILTLILIIFNTENFKIKFKHLFFLACASSICTLMRIPTVLSYLYILIMAIISGEYSRKQILVILAVALIFIPFFLKSILVGTPAISPISSSQPFFDFLDTPSLIFKIMINSVGAPYLLFILLVFIIKITKENIINKLSLILLLISLIFLYFSINHNLWGTVRYVGEYIAPFCGLGILLSIQSLPKKTVSFVSILIIIFNILFYKNFYVLPNFYKVDDFYSRQVERVFDYKGALYEAKRIGLASEVILIGDTYGLMPYVLSGYTYNDIKNKLFIKNIDVSSEEFIKKLSTNDSIFSMVLFYDYPNNKDTIENLIGDGWIKWKDFQSSFSNFNVIALIKKN
jgi:hypothetical protein